MTGWDVLSNIINAFPPVAAVCLLVVAGVILITGFSRHGMNFLKYGFKQIVVNDLMEKLATKEDISKIDTRFVDMESKIDTRFVNMESRIESRFVNMESRIDTRFVNMESKIESRFVNMESKIEAIEVNHFGHLKNYLGILNGVLLDKNIIDNETRARLDNELRGM
jgi:hypothetical protein